MRKEPDYYAILGVEQTATADEIRQRRQHLVRELHPDRHNGDPVYLERLTQVNVAFHELSDEMRRSAYDRRRREASPVQSISGSAGMGSAGSFTRQKPRSPRRADYSAYSANRTSEVKYKHHAVIGAVFAAVGACAIALTLLTIENVRPDVPQFDHYPLYPSGFMAASPSFQVSGDPLNVTAQQSYQQQLTEIIAQVQEAVDASNATAAVLEDRGDSDGAAVLRRHAADVEVELLSASDSVRMLGLVKESSTESRLEIELDKRFIHLRHSGKMLADEQQKDRNSDISIVPPSNNNGTGQSDLVNSSAP